MNKINGPINVVRMEGCMNGVTKVIYLFMDKHVEVEEQTDCNDPSNSIDIAEYFNQNFIKLKDKNKTYDFFLEFVPELIAKEPSELFFITEPKIKYLVTVWKFFYENIKYDASKNKVSSLFDNIRLHYFDIRSVFWYFVLPILNFIIESIENNDKNIYQYVEEIINAIIELLNKMLQAMKNREAPQKNNIKVIKKYPSGIKFRDASFRKEYYDHIVYLMNKFLHGYTNENVKKIIYRYVDSFLIPVWEGDIEYLTNLHTEIKQMNFESFQNDQIKKRFIDEFKMINFNLFESFAKLVDLYFMRRFLDKEYITNAVVYSGAAHSVSYIYMLNSIGFQITHCANCIIQDMHELNNAVARISNFPSEKSIRYLLDMFTNNDNPKQCSDLSTFPILFQ